MIKKILNEISRLKKELDGYSAIEALDYIESYINATSRESASEDLEEACDNYYDETWDEHGGIATVVNNCHDIWFPSQATSDFFKAGAEWQRKKDESRRNANITLANTEIPKDIELEIAFEDIWSDVENCESLDKLSDEQKYKLKSAHHDTFEAGSEWQKQHMMKDAVEAKVSFGQIVLQEKPIQTSVAKDGDCIKVIILKTE